MSRLSATLLSLLAASASAQPPSPAARAVLQKHECNRCHEVEGLAAAAPSKDCAGCHRELASARFDAQRLAKGRKDFGPAMDRFVQRCSESLANVPALSAMGRFRRDWLIAFLANPHDVRPNLRESMPRLSLTDAETAALAEGWKTQPTVPHAAPQPARLSRGEQLFDAQGCAVCHLFGNRPSPAFAPPPGQMMVTFRPRALAPDLRLARERLNRATLLAILEDPLKVNPRAQMPKVALSQADREALADFILHGSPGAPVKPEPVALASAAGAPPPTYEEVEDKVFRWVCWHCHSNPDYADGDGGPGNTGGFGFPAAGLSLATFQDVMDGSLSPEGQRRSIFRKGPSGEPVLLERLKLRYQENQRDLVLPLRDDLSPRTAPRNEAPRGMPLGLPALTPEQYSLVERWIKAGRPAPARPSADGSPMRFR